MPRRVKSSTPTEQFEKICEFCSEAGKINKEHYWPEWLRGLGFKGDEKDKNSQMIIRTRRSKDGKTVIITPKLITKPGHQATKAVKYFCIKCNGGWMNNIQNNTKPILIPFIMDENFRVNKELVTKIVPWITMTTMTAEFTDPETVGISQEERMYFRETLTPPPNFYIWIARYKGELWKTRYYHFGSQMLTYDDAIRIHLKLKEPVHHLNTQSSLFVIGSLAFYVISGEHITHNQAFMNAMNWQSGMMPIYPHAPYELDWHMAVPLTDTDMDSIKMLFARLVAPDGDLSAL